MDFFEDLERTKASTLRHFGLGDRELAKTYGPGKWSVRYVLHHLADAESILFYRIRRVISEPKQVIWVFEQDLWAQKLDYSRVPLDLGKRIYESSRDGVIYYAREHYATSGDIEFVHSTDGRKTLKDEFDKVVWHNQKHLDQIAKALSTG